MFRFYFLDLRFSFFGQTTLCHLYLVIKNSVIGVTCALTAIVIARRGSKVGLEEEWFKCTYRITSQGIVKEYPSRRIEQGKADKLKEIEGGAPSIEHWFRTFSSFIPVVLHFENGEKLALVPSGKSTLTYYQPLLDELGRPWQANPVLCEWKLRQRREGYRWLYLCTNLAGILLLLTVFLTWLNPERREHVPNTLAIALGSWISFLVFAYLWIKWDKRKASDV